MFGLFKKQEDILVIEANDILKKNYQEKQRLQLLEKLNKEYGMHIKQLMVIHKFESGRSAVVAFQGFEVFKGNVSMAWSFRNTEANECYTWFEDTNMRTLDDYKPDAFVTLLTNRRTTWTALREDLKCLGVEILSAK